MPRTYYADQLERWATSAWRRLKLTPPCDLQAVSDYLHIRVERRVLPNDLYGAYIRLPDGSHGIKLNSGLHPARQRYVWAHEIAHALLHRGQKVELVIEFRRGFALGRERDCDRFAACLLMPEVQLRAAAAELGHPTVNKARSLAVRFGVSTQAMRIRLSELGLVHAERPR